MHDVSIEDLRAELAQLEVREALVSAKRRHLHQQIDYGYASEATGAHEHEISYERRQLRQRIDALRKTLSMRQAV